MVDLSYAEGVWSSEQQRRDRLASAAFGDRFVVAAQEFASRHEAQRQLSATCKQPVDLGPRAVRSIARAAANNSVPSIAEQTSGVCLRCGGRLAFGCDHYPTREEASH